MTRLEYDVVGSSDLKEFKAVLDYKINCGWNLQGGVFIGNNMDGTVYYQAIVREIEVE